jgi:hypothetical protein
VPILLLTVLLVRSLTGSTFEVFGLFSIVVLVISLGLRDRNAIQRPIRQQRVEPS